MKPTVIFRDLGTVDYKSAWELQEQLHTEAVSFKIRRREGENLLPVNHLLFCEHPPVYTLGKSGSEKNLLVSLKQMEDKHISFFRTNRGGDITFHGPGQIVGYPIFDLEQFKLPVKKYVFFLEESIIRTLEEFGIAAGRMPGATGVWVDPERPHTRKICAMGIRVSRGITMHGFALNVNTELSYFSYINPCGFTDKAVTSIQKETGNEQDMAVVKKIVKEKLSEVFQIENTGG